MAKSMDAVDPDLSFRKIMKDVEHFGSLHMTWKDKKALENKKVTQLGGKTQKKQRLPLSVARVQMKKQKERQEKMLEHNKILGRFGGQFGRKKATEKKRKPEEERVLKSTFGDFRGGVLDVKHLLHSTTNDGDNNYGKDKNKFKGLGGELGGGDMKKKIKKKGKKKGKKGGSKRKRK